MADEPKKILIPERLRSRKLFMATGLIFLLTQLRSLGIEISPELQAQLIAWIGGAYITVQGLIDLVEKAITAWRSGGFKAAVAAVAAGLKGTDDENVDK